MFFIKDIWEFFCENKKNLANQYLRVASFPECGAEIYITEEHGLPFFQVDVDERSEYEEAAKSKEDAENIYKKLLKIVIDDDVENDTAEGDEIASILTPSDVKRLEELDAATKSMLEIFIGVSAEDACFDKNEIAGLSANIAYLLSDTYGMAIRYPIIEEGEDGAPTVVQYPFEQ